MVNSKLKILLLCLLIVFGFTLISPVLAISPSSINVDVEPPNPAPGDNVTITLSSYAANLDTISISWLVNGKNVTSGIGKKTFSMTAGSAGSSITVVAKIALPDGEIDQSVIIRPATMVMLWEATDSYVPPFYKGKALLSQESDVKVVAIPEIRTSNGMANPKSMTYAWQKDYENAADAGGFGKDFFTFTNDYLNDSNNIGVTATTIDQNYSAQGNINVGIFSPAISFYREDANLGTIWERAVQDGDKVQSGETIMTVPYFMSPKDWWSPDLSFSWFINDLAVSISSGFQKNILPLQVQAGTSGTSKLKVEVDNTNKLTGTVSREINVSF
jgi:hypothetical protein